MDLSRRKMSCGIPADRSFEERSLAMVREPIALSNFLDFSCTNLYRSGNECETKPSSHPLDIRGIYRKEEGGIEGKQEDSSNDALLLSVYIPRCTHIDIGHAWQDAWLATPVKTRKTRRIQTRLVPFAPFQDSLPRRLPLGSSSSFFSFFVSFLFFYGKRLDVEESTSAIVMKSAISLIAAWKVSGEEGEKEGSS